MIKINNKTICDQLTATHTRLLCEKISQRYGSADMYRIFDMYPQMLAFDKWYGKRPNNSTRILSQLNTHTHTRTCTRHVRKSEKHTTHKWKQKRDRQRKSKKSNSGIKKKIEATTTENGTQKTENAICVEVANERQLLKKSNNQTMHIQ